MLILKVSVTIIYVQVDVTTPHIVGQTMLGVVVSVVCIRMQQLPTVLAHHGCWSIRRSYCVAVSKETNCKMHVLGPIDVEISLQTDPTWLLYASVTIACEQQTHFRRRFSPSEKERSDDRKCVCCSQATATTEQKKCWELLAQNFDWFNSNFAQQVPTKRNRICKRT